MFGKSKAKDSTEPKAADTAKAKAPSKSKAPDTSASTAQSSDKLPSLREVQEQKKSATPRLPRPRKSCAKQCIKRSSTSSNAARS